ncbi:MAG: hypothetical protein AB1442_00485 [Nitrospirota bacterium]
MVTGLQEATEEEVGLRSLAEAVILQSMADLWNRDYHHASKKFFRGEGFTLWAALAGIGPLSRIRLLNLIQKEILNGN